jgi:hypothetical protein
MLKKIIIIILSLILVSMLGKSFLKLFEWDIEFGEPQKIWAKITNVKVIEHKIRVGNRVGMSANVGSYENWRVTATYTDGRSSTIDVIFGPVPKVGNCIPVISSELSNGNVVAKLNVEEWRFGTQIGSC